MKDIGAKLKEARESIDISIEEAANDLKVTNSQIENIEAGNLEAFQDIFYLKYFIRDYAKYLGLKYDDLVDVIQGLVQKYNVPQKYFELELTESAFLDNEGAVNSTLIRLQTSSMQIMGIQEMHSMQLSL